MGKALKVFNWIEDCIKSYMQITLDDSDRQIIKEAKAELEEAMKPKTCEGCKYYSPYRQQECLHEKYCQREFTDYYEPKDNA